MQPQALSLHLAFRDSKSRNGDDVVGTEAGLSITPQARAMTAINGVGTPAPAHPGTAIRQACLKPFRLTVTEAAKALGVTRKTLSDVVNGHNGVSATMAIRLEQVFGGSADAWMRMQMHHDLWRARQRQTPLLVTRRFVRPAPP